MSDDRLVSALRDGDRAALAVLVERHAAALYRLAYRMTGNREDAEDLVQETFTRMMERLDRYRPRGRFASWLRSIAVHLAIDGGRRRRDPPPLQDVADESPGPEEQAARRDEVRRVRAALAQLPTKYRAVVILVNGEGLPVREVAKMLGLPRTVVKNRALRARAMLRDILARPAGEEARPVAQRQSESGFEGATS